MKAFMTLICLFFVNSFCWADNPAAFSSTKKTDPQTFYRSRSIDFEIRSQEMKNLQESLLYDGTGAYIIYNEQNGFCYTVLVQVKLPCHLKVFSYKQNTVVSVTWNSKNLIALLSEKVPSIQEKRELLLKSVPKEIQTAFYLKEMNQLSPQRPSLNFLNSHVLASFDQERLILMVNYDKTDQLIKRDQSLDLQMALLGVQ
ncbi:MAG: hypothetical protein D6797_07525 [Bdellovibrio sp.]|nr:MAG: hypothetical protein D6797_07525 [Bdellovibrio sp.]